MTDRPLTKPGVHLTTSQLEARLDHLRLSPPEVGTVDLIVVRPAVDKRTVIETGVLDEKVGLIGDNWKLRGSGSTEDGVSDHEAQLTVMNSRVAALVAQDPEYWKLAGDQIYADYDLSIDNLPAGSRLAIGTAVIEVSAKPHTGCAKFAGRFGADALRFVNVGEGKRLRLRGLNAKIVQGGTIRRGDAIRKLGPGEPLGIA